MSAETPSTDGSPRRVLFREEQRFRQWWIWVVLALSAGVAWWGFVEQIVLGRPFGSNPAPDALVWVMLGLAGVGLPLLLRNIRLVVEVDAAGVTLRFRPFRTRRIEARDIRFVEAKTYRPLREYGGWGIRYSARRGWAYTVKGDQGVLLGLADDKQVLIGSGRAEALAAAVAGIRPKGDC